LKDMSSNWSAIHIQEGKKGESLRKVYEFEKVGGGRADG